jgi:threonyl-tRNA synthetase
VNDFSFLMFRSGFKRLLSSVSEHRLHLFQQLSTLGRKTCKASGESIDENTLWHSSSHILGWALEKTFGNDCLLANGPATSDGFFYDMLLIPMDKWIQERNHEISKQPSRLWEPELIEEDIRALLNGEYGDPYFVKEADLKVIEKSFLKLKSRNAAFESMIVSRDEALDAFKYSPFKLKFISEILPETPISIFRCGDFVDLCTGPHLKHSGLIQAVNINKTGAISWSQSNTNSLCRVSGVSFSSKQQLNEYIKTKADAEKRNHRVVGQQQKLFMFSDYSPGTPFILPYGMRILEKIKNELNRIYKKHGFEEVVTPLIFDKQLWVKSGHWQNYKDDMYSVSGGDDSAESSSGLKPMNCPGHCLIYKSEPRSYRDLPIRYMEYSPLHRYLEIHQK